jgi:3-hydroxyisobutyrate dehydrogenase-like beta-hydroxyacid dehydrogenase
VTVGVVSPGAMGSAVGAALVRGGARVVVTLAGRSDRTRRLAETAGLNVLGSLVEVVDEADVVFSVAPPDAARSIAGDLARACRDAGSNPLVADLNAIAPATARALADELSSSGIDFVDGSISGPPPWKPGTRVYLSGARAAEIADLPLDGVERIVVGDDVGSASAVKMSTASIYKGTSALLAQALLAAHANGVLEHVLDELRTGSPELIANAERRLASAASKSARYVGEMHQIAATQATAGLTSALFEAMAEVYRELEVSELAQSAPEDLPRDLELEDVLERLRKRTQH